MSEAAGTTAKAAATVDSSSSSSAGGGAAQPVAPPPLPTEPIESSVKSSQTHSDVSSSSKASSTTATATTTTESSVSTNGSGSADVQAHHRNHPFFHYYGMLVHQQNMLQDAIRTGTYQQAMLQNPSTFRGAVVLDVGTGSGILAHFAVQAGAKHVYAVEASDVADRARQLLEANGLGDRITVLKGTVEEVELPEKVDVIVSEPMGFLLVHEQMLQSYMVARQRFLKPGGLVMPTIGTIHVAPITDHSLWNEQLAKSTFWDSTDFYGLNLTSLKEVAVEDHFSQPVVGTFDPSSIISSDVAQHVINFNSDAPESLDRIEIPLNFTITKTAMLHGLGAWFDVLFDGKDAKIKLDTGPYTPATHWYQCRMLFPRPLAVNASQKVEGKLLLTANKKYSYNIEMSLTLAGTTLSTQARMNLQDQQYSYLNQQVDYSGY